jgi:hypothetical protein
MRASKRGALGNGPVFMKGATEQGAPFFFAEKIEIPLTAVLCYSADVDAK